MHTPAATANILVGLLSEIAGVHTGIPFSTYAYTDALQPQLFDVPIVIPLAWAMMAYPAWRIGELLGSTPVTRALFAAGALTAWDVALDPQMVGLGIWEWPNGGAYFGIPLINFAGWFLVGSLLFGRRRRISGGHATAEVVVAVDRELPLAELIQSLAGAGKGDRRDRHDDQDRQQQDHRKLGSSDRRSHRVRLDRSAGRSDTLG